MTHTVAITGAGGFIGAQAAQRYAAMGWQVRGLDLPGISQPHVHETLTGNITDPDALAQLVNGADLVLHTAAIVAESGDWSAFHQINAAAPALVAIAAKTAGVQSFVHLSSVMVHGFDYPDGSTEDAASTRQTTLTAGRRSRPNTHCADSTTPASSTCTSFAPAMCTAPEVCHGWCAQFSTCTSERSSMSTHDLQ